ncbi:MAG: hypothetical protein ABIZ70_12045 [Gemmatimonadales bacterium]
MRRLVVLALLLLVPALSLQAQSVAGNWDAGMTTPGGSSSFKLLLRVKGDTVSGTVYRAAGEVTLTGVVRGDTLRFVYTILYNEAPFPLSVTARVIGDSLAGAVDFDGKGEQPFWAKRTKPNK